MFQWQLLRADGTPYADCGFPCVNVQYALAEKGNWSPPENPYRVHLVEFSKFSDGSKGSSRVVISPMLIS